MSSCLLRESSPPGAKCIFHDLYIMYSEESLTIHHLFIFHRLADSRITDVTLFAGKKRTSKLIILITCELRFPELRREIACAGARASSSFRFFIFFVGWRSGTVTATESISSRTVPPIFQDFPRRVTSRLSHFTFDVPRRELGESLRNRTRSFFLSVNCSTARCLHLRQKLAGFLDMRSRTVTAWIGN